MISAAQHAAQSGTPVAVIIIAAVAFACSVAAAVLRMRAGRRKR